MRTVVSRASWKGSRESTPWLNDAPVATYGISSTRRAGCTPSIPPSSPKRDAHAVTPRGTTIQ